jgi:hypothetical protein
LFAPQILQISPVECLFQKIERDLFRAMGRDSEAASIYSDAVTGANVGGDKWRSDLQLRAAIGRANPQHGPDFFNQPGEHIETLQ